MMLFDDFATEPKAPRPVLRPAPLQAHPLVAGVLHQLTYPLTAKARGLLITVRGAGQSCVMALRTQSMRPGQSYQAGFIAPADWVTLNLPFFQFQPVGGVLRRLPRPEAIHSYGVITDPDAAVQDLNIARLQFY